MKQERELGDVGIDAEFDLIRIFKEDLTKNVTLISLKGKERRDHENLRG